MRERKPIRSRNRNPEPLQPIEAETFREVGISGSEYVEREGSHRQSTDYDGTDVGTADATAGYRIEAEGDAEFQDARLRGEVTAASFRGAAVVNQLSDPSFASGLDGWFANTVYNPTSTVTHSSTLARTGTHSLRLGGGAGAVYASRRIACAPGDLVYASGWVRKTSYSSPPNEYQNEVVLYVDFLDSLGNYVNLNGTRTIIINGDWAFVELYAAAPIALTDIVEAEISFAHAYVGSNYLYIDDATIGFATNIVVPQLLTSEDDSHQRARVMPHEIGFDGRTTSRPFGMRVERSATNDRLLVSGPWTPLDDAPTMGLVLHATGETEVVFGADRMRNSESGVIAPLAAVGGGTSGTPPALDSGRYLQMAGKTTTSVISSSFHRITLPGGGFPNGLLSFTAMVESNSFIGYYCTPNGGSSSKTRLDFFIWDSTGGKWTGAGSDVIWTAIGW